MSKRETLSEFNVRLAKMISDYWNTEERLKKFHPPKVTAVRDTRRILIRHYIESDMVDGQPKKRDK